jgi:hypothetical protein
VEAEQHRYEPRGFLGRAKGIALAFGLLHISKANERVARLQEQATNLAISNSDDDDCVRLLRGAAARNSDDLEVAAEGALDFVGPESRVSDRAHRLLVAAWSGQPVAPSPLGDEVFERIEALYSTPVEIAYPTLVELQPRLDELNRQFAPRTIAENAKDSVWDELRAALAPLIGPEAEANVKDPLLRTKAAHHIARLFLALRVGLIDEIDYE